jgi:hypothetical protein
MVRSTRLSTRLLEHFYNSAFFGLFSSKVAGHKTTHSSLASRLTTIPAEYFERLLSWAFEHYADLLRHHDKLRHLKRYDSTMVAISSALVSWGMSVGSLPKDKPRTVQLKVTLGLQGLFPKEVSIFHEQPYLSEQRALREAIEHSTHHDDEIVCFDRGLTDRSAFQSFDKQGIKFVTRASEGLRYQLLRQQKLLPKAQSGVRITRDARVYLYGSGQELVEHELRLVEIAVTQDDGSEKRFSFITNIADLDAYEIAEVYRHRWDIEVFFRFIKQELNLKHLINHSVNGVKVQVYVSLLVALLLTVYKVKNKLKGYKLVKLQFEEELLVHLTNLQHQLAPLAQQPTAAVQQHPI